MSETPAINQQTREHPAKTSPTGPARATSTGAGERDLFLAISVDVEEEGLFNGRHPRVPAGVANVAHLRRLEFISRDLGLPPTLLATHAVVQDRACRQLLLGWLTGRWPVRGPTLDQPPAAISGGHGGEARP